MTRRLKTGLPFAIARVGFNPKSFERLALYPRIGTLIRLALESTPLQRTDLRVR
jgi:hypothetical protein